MIGRLNTLWRQRVTLGAAALTAFWGLSEIGFFAPWRSEALFIALSWWLAFLFLCWVGYSLQSLLGQPWLTLPLGPNWILTGALGQFALLVWIFLRSGLNHLFSLHWAVSMPELLLFGVLLAAAAYLSPPRELLMSRPPRVFPRTAAAPSFWSTPLVILVLTILLAMREVPREIMLSSDPDLHLFWARQLMNLGMIPHDLGMWGPQSFGYPAGFAAMNFLWSSLSRVPLPSVIAMQPVFQIPLAFVLIFSIIFSGANRPEKGGYILGLVIVVLVHLFVLPLGYEKAHLEHQALGRSSSLFVLAALWGIWFLFFTAPPERSKKQSAQAAFLILYCLSCALAGLVNPINLFLPPFLLLFSLPRLAIRPVFRLSVNLAAAAASAAVLLLCDPYYSSRLLGKGAHAAVAAGPETFLQKFLEPYREFGLLLLSIYRHLSLQIFSAAISTAAVSILIALYVMARPALKERLAGLRRIETALIVCIAALIAAGVVWQPLFGALPRTIETNLLLPYLRDSIGQFFFLVVFALLSMEVVAVSAWGLSPRLAVTLVFLIGAGVQLLLADDLTNLRPRVEHKGLMGLVSDDDRALLERIEQFSREFLGRRKGGGGFRDVPKILVPNIPAVLPWGEKWLFPNGATRLLPMYQTLPLAFYYGQGSRLYSFDNYQRHVCNHFSIKWLKKRNISFLFLPSDRGPICLKNLEALEHGSQEVFRQGEAVFLRLF